MKRAQVRVNSKTYPLQKYQIEKQIPSTDLEMLFRNIQTRNEYLTRFYDLSLDVSPETAHFQFPPMKNGHFNNNQHPTCKNLIRNLHFRDILQKTKPGIENSVTYMDMLLDLYQRNIIDYKLLTPSARHYMRNGRLGSVFSSYYFRASIMNPFLVYSLQESLLKGARIFTPTLGWTSYCYGFFESSMTKEYVGVDVISSVCEKTKRFAAAHSPEIATTIYCQPSESLAKTRAFRNRYAQHFDVVFFSPPYYRLEMYAGEKQSTREYTTYPEWLDKYWRATVELCHHVLRKGGRMCYILSGYGIDNKEFDLVKDMNEIAREYFTLKRIQPMHNKDVHVTKHKETAEKIILFVKE